MQLVQLAQKFYIAAGVVDVKSFYVETPEDIVTRARQVLEHMPVDRRRCTNATRVGACLGW